MKKRRICALLLALLLLAAGCILTASAEEDEQEAVGQALAGVFGSKVFSENLENDLMFLSTGESEVTGSVAGDVLFAGSAVTISGAVGGNIRGAAGNMTLNGTVAKNVTAAGLFVVTDKDFAQEDTALCMLAGDTVVVYGKVGNLFVSANTVYVLGSVSGELRISATNVVLAEGLSVRDGEIEAANPVVLIAADAAFRNNGAWSYSGGRNATDAELNGMGIEFDLERAGFGETLLAILLNALMTAALALLLAFLLRKENKVAPVFRKKPTKLLLFGLLLLFAMPMVSALLLAPVLTAPAAFLLLALYVIALVNSEAIVAVLLAKTLTPGKNVYLFAALFGAGIRFVAALIPFVGELLSIACMLFSLGWLWMLVFGKKEQNEDPFGTTFVNPTANDFSNDFTV